MLFHDRRLFNFIIFQYCNRLNYEKESKRIKNKRINKTRIKRNLFYLFFFFVNLSKIDKHTVKSKISQKNIDLL